MNTITEWATYASLAALIFGIAAVCFLARTARHYDDVEARKCNPWDTRDNG